MLLAFLSTARARVRTRMSAEDVRSPRSQPRLAGGSRCCERGRGFPPPSSPGLRDQKRALGEEARVRGPPRCVPPTASPPLPLREKRPRAPLLAVGRAGAAEAERGGGRTRCERSRSGPRCWCWARWRASASEVSEAPGGGNAAPGDPHRASCRCPVCRVGAGNPGPRVLRGGSRGERARLGPSEPGAGGPSRPRGVGVMGS